MSSHLCFDNILITVLQLVESVCLQIVHQNCEASHYFCLFFVFHGALAASYDIHFSADPIYFLVIKFDLSSILALARAHTDRVIAHLVSLLGQQVLLLLLYGNDALAVFIHIELPSVVNFFKAPLFKLLVLLILEMNFFNQICQTTTTLITFAL